MKRILRYYDVCARPCTDLCDWAPIASSLPANSSGRGCGLQSKARPPLSGAACSDSSFLDDFPELNATAEEDDVRDGG